MNDPARIIAVEPSISYGGTAPLNGVTVKMREVGQAFVYRGDRKSVEMKVVLSQAKFEDGMIDNCKTLLIGKTHLVDGPETDVLRRSHTLGWYGMYGSPEWDWFERTFPCTRPHSDPPSTIRGCASLAWVILRQRVVRLFRKPVPEFEYDWRYDDED